MQKMSVTDFLKLFGLENRKRIGLGNIWYSTQNHRRRHKGTPLDKIERDAWTTELILKDFLSWLKKQAIYQVTNSRHV